uniref:Pickpocket protein 28 n=1 Tax=Dendroctonus ponderosae TaxID=77166 RepID=A0AAR5PEH1_DENPD
MTQIFWFVTCFTALVLSIGLVAVSWIDFRTDPLMTLAYTTQYKRSEIYFPAATICSFNKISKRAAFGMAHKLLSTFNRTRNKYFSVEKLAHNLKLLARLTDNKYRVLPRKEYNFLTAVLKENQIDEHEVFEQIAPSCTRLLKKCIWKQKLVNCSSIFQTTKTPIGFCCSFSYYALKILNKKGHARHFLRNPGCIFQTGLEVLLDNDPTDYFKSDIPSVGFQVKFVLFVQLHNPFDFPHFALPSILGEINTNNFISVNAEFTSTTEAVKLMAASARNCLFMKERRMKYFNRYNYQNCITECKVATIYEFCGCIPFYLREKTGKSAHFHKPCTIKDQSCIARNQDTIFDIFHNRPSAGISTAKCKCYPNCAYMTYQSHISKGPLDLAYFTKRDSIEFGQNLENSTVIRVFMSSLASNGNRRDVKFSNIGLLGFFGGLVGLLTAFSFITITECIYLFGRGKNENTFPYSTGKLHCIQVEALQSNPNDIQR